MGLCHNACVGVYRAGGIDKKPAAEADAQRVTRTNTNNRRTAFFEDRIDAGLKRLGLWWSLFRKGRRNPKDHESHGQKGGLGKKTGDVRNYGMKHNQPALQGECIGLKKGA